jgi:hypothetical protein
MRPRRVLLVVSVAALGAIAVLAMAASPALAVRSYECQITGSASPSATECNGTGNSIPGGGFNEMWGLTVDSGDNLWVSDTGSGRLRKFDSSGNFLAQIAGGGGAWTFGGYIRSPAYSKASDRIYVADSNQDHTWAITTAAGFGADIAPPWNSGCCFVYAGADNSGGPANGSVYVSRSNPSTVYRFDGAGSPVSFSGSGSNISSNVLSGTPTKSFSFTSDGGRLAVDGSGHLIVANAGSNVVDVFDSSGAFLFEISGTPGGSFGSVRGVAADPTNGDILVVDSSKKRIEEFDEAGTFLESNVGDETPTGSFSANLRDLAVDSNGRVYVSDAGNGVIDAFSANAIVPKVNYGEVSGQTPTSGTLNAHIDPNEGGPVISCKFEYGTTPSYGTEVPCNPNPASSPPGSNFTVPTNVKAGLSGLTTEQVYHYRVVVSNVNGTRKGADATFQPHAVTNLKTGPFTDLEPTSVTFNGSWIGEGELTHYYFEWGTSTAYGHETPSMDGGSETGPNAVSEGLSGLTPITTFHYRIVAYNGVGTSYGADMSFETPPNAPVIRQWVTDVHTDTALIHGEINPGGGITSYRLEFVPDGLYQVSGFEEAEKTPIPDAVVGTGVAFVSVEQHKGGLQPGTAYRYRIVATNAQDTTYGPPSVLRTFPYSQVIDDPCPNAHVRQQTGAALLLDCRAYELVSTADASGYDVESDLAVGQTPFGSYGRASNPARVLYGIHGGALGTGNPTNHGVDPYVATRTDSGWKTEYVGIPANNPGTSGPFASTLLEADQGLGAFAFGGAEICSPCFADGSSGVPIHLPNGSLVQGMAGSLDPGSSAKPSGFVGRRFSADGNHFVFASTSKFESDGNENGDVTVYDRDLKEGLTQVVSKTPAGATMTGPGIGELDISSNGSRIVIGRLVSESAGARYWHLYMHVEGSAQTVDLTPGTTSGVLYGGMTADGSKVFFTTADALSTASNQDTDESADAYRADVSGSGATLTRISTGAEGTGDTDSCVPAANTVHTYWNTTGSEPDCGVVAVGGGGGIATADGTFYFLSPEKLDGSGHGVQNAPNLYLARPGQVPHFVTTLESSANATLPEAQHSFLQSVGSFALPTGVAYDAAGNLYVLDLSGAEIGGVVEKFDPAGNADASFGTGGKLTGPPAGKFEEFSPIKAPSQIAVDNDPGSPNYGDLYVPDLFRGAIERFSSSGTYEGKIDKVEVPTGVAVDPATGKIYVTQLFGGVRVFSPAGTELASFSTISEPTGVAVDSTGTVYVVNGGGNSGAEGEAVAYSPSGVFLRKLKVNQAMGVGVDYSNDHVFVAEKDRLAEFDSTGGRVGGPIGVGRLSSPISVAIDQGKLAASNSGPGKVAVFGPAARPPFPSTDNPLVVDSVTAPGDLHTADFQVAPNGDSAIFTSTLPLTPYDNAGHREVLRYSASADGLDCASCPSTGALATRDAALPVDGLALTDDGRVFFNSGEGLVDRDLNNKEDAYEWEPAGIGGCAPPAGCLELISAGTSPTPSSLLGASADGIDAHFFTRDKLVAEDGNGSSVKIYDARAFGGFPFVPNPVPCKASDECHGPGSDTPPPANIKSTAGTPESVLPAAKCRKGFVKKSGRCVKRRKARKQTKRHRGTR